MTQSNVYYGVDNTVWGQVPFFAGFQYEQIVPTANLSEGPHQLFVRLVDDNGQTLIQKELEIQGAEAPAFPLLFFIIALAAAVLITAFVIIVRTRKQVIPPEDIFLIYSNGLLIRHLAGGEKTDTAGDDAPDNDLVTSMLVAIQDFVKDSFSRGSDSEADLKHIGFGDKTILMEKSRQIILAFVVPGRPKDLDLNAYEKHMGDAAWEIVSAYKGKLDDWDGDIDAFPGLEEKLSPSFDL